jgi:DNA ligase D-like protein (predicted 3'-phosphoesterase)
MLLEEYRKKRSFTETPEPVGRVRRAGRSRIFVVQKHDASRLHYDFRLEINGVLASWAVPKGPSMNPAEKRLAIRTEDHPLEYADFEGVIPEGQYGAGTVMVWDKGEYKPEYDVPPDEQLARGKIEMALHGKKLRGVLRWSGWENPRPVAARGSGGCSLSDATIMLILRWTLKSPSLLAPPSPAALLRRSKRAVPEKGANISRTHHAIVDEGI